MKKVLVIVLMVVPVWGFAEWIAPEEFSGSAISLGYEKAWKERNQYDDVFYKMMQLGRGIESGDKIVLLGASRTKPVKQDKEYWAYIFHPIESSISDRLEKGAVIAILRELPSGFERETELSGFIFARYVGVIEGYGGDKVPLLVCDKIALVRQVIDAQAFEYDEEVSISDLTEMEPLLNYLGR